MTSMKAGDEAPCLLFVISKSLLLGEEEKVERDAATATMIMTIIIETVIARTMRFLRRDGDRWGGSDSDGAS